jgi:hypothetical protein
VACGAAICAVALILVPRFPLGGMLHPSFYQRDARMTAVAAVPSGVTVEAAGGVGPELSARDTVLLWDGENPPRWAPWVVADVAHVEFSFTTIKAEKQRVALLRQHGYRSVFEQGGYIVLHRAGPVARAGLSQAAGR